MADAAYDRQIALEQEMRDLGVARYRQMVAKARDNIQEAQTKPGVTLVKATIDRMVAEVEEFFSKAESGRAGKKFIAYAPLKTLDPETVAFITAKVVIDSISQRNSLQTIARVIGATIEEEMWFRHFAKTMPGLWHVITMGMEEEGVGSNLRQMRLKALAKKYGAALEPWDLQKRYHVGVKCVDMMIQSTGLFELQTFTDNRGHTRTILKPTQDTMTWLEEAHQYGELMSPVYLPMVSRPLDWTNLWDGGYYTNAALRLPLIKQRDPEYMRAMKTHNMPAVYAAVNAIQSTPWQVNAEVLTVIKQLWAAKSTLGKLPTVIENTIPPFPEGSKDKEEIAKWKRAACEVHNLNGKRKSKRIACAKTLWVAEKFTDEREFFFPVYCDFRGRVYTRPVYLTPQGPDYAKALLRFAIGLPLDERGACWLAIQGANTFGYDKADLQARIDWVQDNQARIVACAADPFENRWWGDADKPFQFLAFCFEWAGWVREGPGYISRIPIALDGSCNGLQHFSMALRDKESGAAVNLVPSDNPADIYQQVADRVKLKVCLDASTSGSITAMLWRDSGLITRKLCKQPVMTLPYGATHYGMKGAIVDYLIEASEEAGAPGPFGTENFAAAVYIAKVIWDAISETVVAARRAMKFLQECAKVASRESMALTWVTPSGFPVLQEYHKTVGKQVKTQIGGELIKLVLSRSGTEADKRRQTSGVSPNFVHSLDSSHLMATVNLSAHNGVVAFAMVHDSFGTHAANTEVLGACLRHAFVEMYQVDVLAEFRQSIAEKLSDLKNLRELPPVPERGELDPKAVLESDFFFS